ncbi:MAG TPA: outer membrane beta-barrel protein [Bacteroidota bacterium]|nr:outer membrane beta-barrel protein [Bacteroidota bacterium]
MSHKIFTVLAPWLLLQMPLFPQSERDENSISRTEMQIPTEAKEKNMQDRPELAALLIFSSSSFIQEEGRAELYLHGGLSFPFQPKEFSDYWKMGFNIGGGLGYSFSPYLALVGHVDYNNFAFDEDGFLKDLGFSGLGIKISGGSASIFTVSGNLKATLTTTPHSVSPYFIGGIGFFSISISEVTVSGGGVSVRVEGDSESAFCVSFGPGIDISAAETVSILLEGKYVIGFTENENTTYIPLKAGIKVKL